MRLDHPSLSERVRVRLERATAPSAATLRQILGLLVREFNAHDAALFLPVRKGVAPALLLQHSGPSAFRSIPRRSSRTPHLQPAADKSITHADGVLTIPFPAPFRGALTLRTSQSDPTRHAELSIIAALLAAPTEAAAVLQLSTRLANANRLLGELHQLLISSTTVEQLLDGGGRRLLQHKGMVGTILRVVQSRTVLLPPRLIAASVDSDILENCLTLEPDLAQTVASHLRPVRRRFSLSRHGRTPHARSVTLYVLPLTFAGDCFGTLTLIFDADPTDTEPFDQSQRTFFASAAALLGQGLAQLAVVAAQTTLEGDHERKVRELSTLFRISRALHGIPRINELMHFILAAATSQLGGDFDRAMLFLANEQTGSLQGILGLTRASAQLTFRAGGAAQSWESADLGYDTQRLQRQTSFCQEVLRQRLLLSDNSPVTRAFARRRIIFAPRPEDESVVGMALAVALDLGPYVCVPLVAGERVLGVLVADNPLSRQIIDTDRLGFLELFSSLAGAALGNALLVKQLENASQHLHETQDRLLHGERLAVLGEMAASVAHELKTPLVSIGGFARRLSHAPAGPQSAEYAGIIARETTRMEELLAGILSFAKKQFLCYSPCHLGAVIEQALQLEHLPLAQSGVHVTCEIDPQLPVIQADEAKLRQVLLNLIANARQAMPAGGTLEISAVRTRFRNREAVEIAVADSGPGIPAEAFPQLFHPFFSTKECGTGLGLPISAQIIQQHHGEIEASNRRKGAIFLIRLPVG